MCRVIKIDLESIDLPDFKIIKPLETSWLAHKLGIEAAKASYSSIVLALETSHEPEALVLSNALSKHSTIAAIY